MKKPNLVFMYGEDAFSMNQELQRWKAAFVEKHGDMNLEILRGEESDITGVSGAIHASPFLGDKRLVILLNFLKHQKAEPKKALVPVLETFPDSTVFVIAEDNSPDKRSALFKALTKLATLRLFEKPKGAQLNTWIVRQTQKHGGDIDSRTAAYLASVVGDNLWQLEHEVQKLCLYARGHAIHPEMVDELVQGSVEQSIFALTDQLAQRDVKGALQTMRQLQEQGQEAPYLFAMITRQFRLMLEMKQLMDEGRPANAIAKQMGVHPFVVQKTLSHVRHFSTTQLKQALNSLLKLDRRLKTGGIHLRPREEDHYLLALERIVIEQGAQQSKY